METIEEIKEKAMYCLNCKNKPCQNSCPIRTNIPEFINQIKENDIKKAYEILMDNNIFSPICSSICPQERQCEGSCTRGIKSNAVEIGKLEKWVNEYAKENSIKYQIKTKEKNSHKAAIIGSGPASLSCAYELAKKGINVTIYEKEEQLGGVLRYGIPDYRLSKTDLEDTIKKILSIGIQVKTKCELGKDIHINELKKQGYETIFVGIGAGRPNTYFLSNENLKGIYESDNFLKQYNKGKENNNIGETFIIGGGNVAIDCARSAVRMGASKVTILYRRGIENMPARRKEIQEAIEDNIEIIPYTKVIKATGKNGQIEEIECIKTKNTENKLVEIPNTEYKIKANTLIFAIGLTPEIDILEKEGLKTENGLLKVDENGKTNIEGVYAGGDVTEKNSTVCRAIAAGKKIGKSIL